MNSGYHPQSLSIRLNGTQIGLALFNMDLTCQSQFRYYLRHISITKPAKLEEAVVKVSNYIFEKMGADAIRIDLYHFLDKDDPNAKVQKADAEVKEALIQNKKGYKWKTLLNDPATGRRHQVMEMPRPKDMPPPEHQKEPLAMKGGLILRVHDEKKEDTKGEETLDFELP
jgi:hypothetical protein